MTEFYKRLKVYYSVLFWPCTVILALFVGPPLKMFPYKFIGAFYLLFGD